MIHKCAGFIDVTKNQVCRRGRPNAIQQSVYSVHKRMYCLLFCNVTTPDAIMFFCDGLVEGRRYDLFLLEYTALDNALAQSLNINNEQY